MDLGIAQHIVPVGYPEAQRMEGWRSPDEERAAVNRRVRGSISRQVAFGLSEMNTLSCVHLYFYYRFSSFRLSKTNKL